MRDFLKELWWMFSPVIILATVLIAIDRWLLLRDFRRLVDDVYGTDFKESDEMIYPEDQSICGHCGEIDPQSESCPSSPNGLHKLERH
ncbi:MAG TPA: hypothetical protein PKW33_15515 [Anaerolineaceae bacterium]|nr:hypothetical protein [Anaerolineaceae bacterium]HPN53003.1 hypothetical protein [Anaerolineaceae bacterium]